MNWLSLLSGAGGGGGFGGGNDSAASQSTPFYNQSGIYFNSDGAGTITAGDVGSSAASGAPTRGTGPAPVADSVGALDFGSVGGGGNALLYIVGAAVAALVLILVIFKK